VPNGGYITSVILRVASLHFQTTLAAQKQPNTQTVHLSFVRRTSIGPALFTVTDTKLGRQTSTIHISLSQENRTEVVGYLTHSSPLLINGPSLPTGYALTPPPLPASLPLLHTDTDPNYILSAGPPYPSFRKATLRAQFWYPKSASWTSGQKFNDQWTRLSTFESHGEKWDTEGLGYVCDMFRQAVEGLEDSSSSKPSTSPPSASKEEKPPSAKYWYPTLTLTLDIKKPLLASGSEWLFVRNTNKQIKDGKMDIEVVILDEAGEIVALSHHVALVVGTERNLGKRGGQESKI